MLILRTKKLLIASLSLALLLSLLPGMGTTAFAVQGNNTSNIANGGYITEVNGWIYFRDDATNSIYKERVNGTGKTAVVKNAGNPVNISVTGNNLYYIDAPAPGTAKAVYKVNAATGAKTKIAGAGVPQFIIHNNYIYYTASFGQGLSNNHLYRMDLNGNSKTKLMNGKIKNFTIDSQAIYFEDGNTGLFKVSHTGKNKTKLTNDRVTALIADGGWIYYSEANSQKLNKIRTNGTSKKGLTSFYVKTFVVEGSRIFYTLQSEFNFGTSVYVMTTEGKHNKSIIDVPANFALHKTDSAIYFSAYNGLNKNYEFFKQVYKDGRIGAGKLFFTINP